MPNKNSLSFTNDTLVTSFCLIGINYLRTMEIKKQRSNTINATKENPHKIPFNILFDSDIYVNLLLAKPNHLKLFFLLIISF